MQLLGDDEEGGEVEEEAPLEFSHPSGIKFNLNPPSTKKKTRQDEE